MHVFVVIILKIEANSNHKNTIYFIYFSSCDGQDSIKIYIKIDNDEKELDYTCGKKIPKMFMSNIPWMKVVFESGSRTQHSNTGFAFEYKFLTSKFSNKSNGS